MNKISPYTIFISIIVFPLFLLKNANFTIQLISIASAAGLLIYCKKPKRAFVFTSIYFAAIILEKIIIRFMPSSASQIFSAIIVMLIKLVPVFMLSSILAYDTKIGEIISSLQRIHLPKPIIIAVTVAIRYIPTFGRESKYIKKSMRNRGIKLSILRPVEALEYYLVPILFRSFYVSEELTCAGLTKGIDSKLKRSSIFDIRLGVVDYIYMLIIISTSIFIFIGGKYA